MFEPSSSARVFNDILPDDLCKLFNGKDCISGTNFSYINSQIKELLNSKESLSQEEKLKLTKYYSEIKRTKDGKRKPKTCWDFVNNGHCIHCNNNNNNYGIILGNKWHPEVEERNYLRNKKVR